MDKHPGKFIGLVGLGYWGKNILRNLYELDVLITACDSDPAIISERKKDFPDVDYVTSLENILQNSTVKAVAIAAPAVAHYDFVKKSLLAGKDVFVEKPLSLTVKEGNELVELAEDNNRILMVGHILQYHPAVIKLKELISTGELGKIRYIYSNRLNIGKLRTEENILWSFAPHDISVLLMLLEEEPIKVSAYGGAYLNKGIYDTTMTNLKFKNGVRGHIFVNWLHPYKEQKLIVVGSRAMAVFDDVSNDKLCIYPHTIKWKNGKIPIAQKADYQVISLDNGEPLRRELSHFIECVRERKTPVTDGREGLRVLKVLESAESSLNNTLKKDFFAHENACIENGAQIGEGTKIWHYSHILKDSSIGNSCILGQNVFVGSGVNIGDRCKIQNNVSIFEGVTLEDEVFCGPSCVFTNVYNPRAFIERKYEFRKTLVKKGATIGANATVVCGVTIGRYALVGAGAVVKSDIPDHAIVVGVPAIQIGWACICGVTLKDVNNRLLCDGCDNKYVLEDGSLISDSRNGQYRMGTGLNVSI